MRKLKRNGIWYVTMAAFIWSFSGFATKAVSWNGISVYMLRGIVSCVLMMLMTRRFPGKISGMNFFLAICYALQSMLFVIANKYTTAANATVLQNTSPFYIILFEAFMSQRLPKRKDVMFCLALFTGVAMSCLGNYHGDGLFGNLAAMMSALFYAAVFAGGKYPGADTIQFMIWGNGLSILLLPWFVTDQSVWTSDTAAWLGVIIFGVMVTAAWILFALGIRTTSPLQANFIAMLEPVLAPVWTFFLLGERLTLFSVTGLAIVIGTLFLYNASENTRV